MFSKFDGSFSLVVTFVVLLASNPAIAGQKDGKKDGKGDRCRSVNGTLASIVVPIGGSLSDGTTCAAAPGLFCTTGVMVGDIRGIYDFSAITFDPLANPDFGETGVGIFTGQLVLRMKDGTLVFKDAGAFDAIPGSRGDFASVLTVVQGTEALAAATGRLRDEGIFINGCVDCTYRGEICLPRRRD
jgi:hypothetical protein